MRRLNAAYAALAAARAELAAASVVGQLPARGHAHAALTAHRDRLLAMPGVLGVGLGVGAARQPMISVFVRSDGADDRNMWDELSGAQLRVAGRGIGVEVVPFGGLKPVPQPVSVAGGPDQRKAAKAMRLAPGDGIGQVDRRSPRCTWSVPPRSSQATSRSMWCGACRSTIRASGSARSIAVR
ncbi:MAG: hypothetical protein E6J90_03015 [Deltaproteobacteria bacterium]|nr:MAG: hypothetical protein E6J90_03015 [Deltaproteobacteria bacterium]